MQLHSNLKAHSPELNEFGLKTSAQFLVLLTHCGDLMRPSSSHPYLPTSVPPVCDPIDTNSTGPPLLCASLDAQCMTASCLMVRQFGLIWDLPKASL